MTDLKVIDGGVATGSVVNLTAIRSTQAEAQKAKTSQRDMIAIAHEIVGRIAKARPGLDWNPFATLLSRS